MTNLHNNSASTSQRSRQTKQTTLSALEPLTRSEIDALRQKKKRISDYYQKVLSKQLVGRK